MYIIVLQFIIRTNLKMYVDYYVVIYALQVNAAISECYKWLVYLFVLKTEVHAHLGVKVLSKFMFWRQEGLLMMNLCFGDRKAY